MPTLTPIGDDRSFLHHFFESLELLVHEHLRDWSSSQVTYDFGTTLKGSGFRLDNGELTAGTINAIEVSGYKAAGLNISATEFQAALDAEWSGRDPEALEALFYGLAWTYEGTSATDDANFSFFTGDLHVNFGNGDDHFLGGSGDDEVRGGGGYDHIVGNEGNDLLFGGEGGANLFAGEGNDAINTGTLPGDAYGGSGKDVIDASQVTAWRAIVFGDDGDDRIIGGTAGIWAFGGHGNDTVTGAKGFDTLEGGSGKDRLDGGGGSDTLLGGDGNDALRGDGEIDTLAAARAAIRCEAATPTTSS